MQADWHEVWHSPQAWPVAGLRIEPAETVTICVIGDVLLELFGDKLTDSADRGFFECDERIGDAGGNGDLVVFDVDDFAEIGRASCRERV